MHTSRKSQRRSASRFVWQERSTSSLACSASCCPAVFEEKSLERYTRNSTPVGYTVWEHGNQKTDTSICYSSILFRMQVWKEHTFWTDGYFACSVGNVSEEMLRKCGKNIKTIAIFLNSEYTIRNRVARSLLDIGDQAESCAQLFYVKERFYGFEKTIDL